MRVKRIVPLGIFVFFVLFVCSVFVYWKTTSFKENDNPIVFFIKPNETFQSTFDSELRSKLRHPKLFYYLAKKMNLPNHFFAGKYSFSPKSNMVQVIRKIRSGNYEHIVIDLPKGISQDSLIEILSSRLFLSKEKVSAALTGLLQNGNQNQEDLMPILSMCFADRYFLPWAIDSSGLLDFFRRNYNSVWDEHRKAMSKKLGLKCNEAMALASIVEAEVVFPDEMQRVAGVYLNRLRKNWKLNADPSIRFILRNKKVKRILHKDLGLINPYNTYQFYGLPPGGIGLISVDALDAVLNFEQHDFMFFCAKPDLSFRHVFTQTYAEHLRVARKYQNALNERNIKR